MGVVLLDNFRQGEHGSLGPRGAPDGTYHGQNVLTFSDGSVGPRSGLKAVITALAGTSGAQPPRMFAASHPSSDFITTRPRILAVGATVASTYNKVYDLDLDATTPTRTDYAVAPTVYALAYLMPWVKATPASVGVPRIIFGAPGDKLYTADPATRTLAPLAGTPGAGALALHGSRLMAAAGDQYLRYSDPNALGVFGALSFIPVGPDYNPICGLWEVQDRLIIAKTDGTLWMLTGTPGVNETLRRVYDGGAPRLWHEGMVTPGGTLWFTQAGSDYPTQFTGAGVAELKHLSEYDATLASFPTLALGSQSSMWSPLGSPDDALCLSYGNVTGKGYPMRLLTKRNNAWTRHTISSTISQAAFNATTGEHRVVAQAIDQTGVVAIWAKPTAFSASIYLVNFGLDRPGFDDTNGRGYATGDYLDNGAAIPTLFEPPQQWGADEVLVRRVMIELERWDLGTGVVGNVGFTLTAKAYGRRGAYGPVSSTPQVVSMAQGTASGTPDWVELYFGDQGEGCGWQLSFSGIVGVSIRSILVETGNGDP